MEDLDEVDDFGYYVERETFNDQKSFRMSASAIEIFLSIAYDIF